MTGAKMRQGDMIVNRVALDWVSVGSFDQRDRRRFSAALDANMMRKSDNSRLMQYSGESWESGFVGQAEQDDRLHTFCKVSGPMADKCLFDLIRYSTREAVFTRIDIQITIRLPESYSARELNDYFKLLSKKGVNPSLIENGGLDTVYVGSRKSARFWRIYVKEDSTGERWLRFEIEIKKDRDKLPNRIAMFAAKFGRRAILSYFWDQIDKLQLPLELESELGRFREAQTAKLPAVVRDEGEKTFKWLDTTVKRSILNFASRSHGRSEFMVGWLGEIAEQIRSMETKESEFDMSNK